MDVEGEFLYRGTTIGWPGTRANQSIPVTCTSTDPYVATCFALECARWGRSVVQIARRSSVDKYIEASNYFHQFESAVNLKMTAKDFLEHVTRSIGVRSAQSILVELGFAQIPYLIDGLNSLHEELKESHRRGDRLSDERKRLFNQLAIWGAP